MVKREYVIRIDILKKELSDIKLSAQDLAISQKAVRVTHLTEQNLRKRIAAKRHDLMLDLQTILHHAPSNLDLSLKLYEAIVSYRFFKKTIPLDVRNDPFEKNLLKLTQKLSRAETAKNHQLKFKWQR